MTGAPCTLGCRARSLAPTEHPLEAFGGFRPCATYPPPVGNEPINDEPAEDEAERSIRNDATGDEPVDDEPHASDSSAQRAAESYVLAAASDRFGVVIAPRTVTTPYGLTVKIDGVAGDRSVLAEVYVRQTPLNPGNERKVLADALRLVWFREFYAPDARLMLCLTSYAAARKLKWPDNDRPTSWMVEALRGLGVDVEVFDLPDGGGSIRDAQTRQFR